MDTEGDMDTTSASSSPQPELCDECRENNEATHACLRFRQKMCLPCHNDHDGRCDVSLPEEKKERRPKEIIPSDKQDGKQDVEVSPQQPDQLLVSRKHNYSIPGLVAVYHDHSYHASDIQAKLAAGLIRSSGTFQAKTSAIEFKSVLGKYSDSRESDVIGAKGSYSISAQGSSFIDRIVSVSTDERPVGEGEKKSPKASIYDNSPKSVVEVIWPIRNRRVWAMYGSLPCNGSVLSLLNAEGQLLFAIVVSKRLKGFFAIDDDTLAWCVGTNTIYCIRLGMTVKRLKVGIQIRELASCPSKDTYYLRAGSDPEIRRVKFAYAHSIDRLRAHLGVPVAQVTLSEDEVVLKDAPRQGHLVHVSEGGRYFAFFVEGDDAEHEYVEVKVYSKDDTGKVQLVSSYAPSDEVGVRPRDALFCKIGEGEWLLVIAYNDHKVHIIDHTDGCRREGYLDTAPLNLHNPSCLAIGFDQRLWIGCQGGQVMMVSLQPGRIAA